MQSLTLFFPLSLSLFFVFLITSGAASRASSAARLFQCSAQDFAAAALGFQHRNQGKGGSQLHQPEDRLGSPFNLGATSTGLLQAQTVDEHSSNTDIEKLKRSDFHNFRYVTARQSLPWYS